MGLFADTCQALVDRASGRALTGEALEKAKLDPKWPRCGYSVKKAARGCSKCGSPAPGGWTKCPACGKWVGNESNFCWGCSKPLYPESRALVSGGVWQRHSGVFAEVVDVGDIKDRLKEGFMIEEGTAAILLDGGKFKDVLAPGRHNLDSLARRINFWGDPPPRSAVLLDNGDVVLPLRIEGLRSADNFPLDLYTEVAIHFVEKGGQPFVANLLKSARHLSYEEVAGRLAAEIRYTAENICNTSNIEDLVKDPQRRLQVEDALTTTLKTALERYGLEIVRVAAAEFISNAFEELRAKAGELEVRRRQLEFDQRMRELVLSDKMGTFKSEKDLAEYVAQLAQERGISSAHREQEMARLRQVQRHELDKDEAAFQMAREMEQAAHEVGIKMTWDDYTRSKIEKDAELQDRLKKMEISRSIQEAMDWLKVKAEKMRVKREHMAETAKILEGKDIQTLIAMIPDPDQREHLLKLHRQTQQAGRSAEEILAMAAEHSPAAADALKSIATVNRQQLEKEYGDRKKLTDESAERLERILKTSLEAMAKAAQHQGTNTQVIK